MTVYATAADLQAYAVGLALPVDVSGALAQGNHWVVRQVEKAEAVPTGSALVDLKYAACARALSVLAGNGQVTVGEQSIEALELGPFKLKLGKEAARALPDFATQAWQHLADAGLGEVDEVGLEVFTRVRRRW